MGHQTCDKNTHLEIPEKNVSSFFSTTDVICKMEQSETNNEFQGLFFNFLKSKKSTVQCFNVKHDIVSNSPKSSVFMRLFQYLVFCLKKCVREGFASQKLLTFIQQKYQ